VSGHVELDQKLAVYRPHVVLAAFVVGLAIATVLWRLVVPNGTYVPVLGLPTPSYLPQYAAMFTVGVLAYRRGWLTGLTRRTARWAWVAAAAAVVVLGPVAYVLTTGFAAEVAVAVFEAVFATGMIIGLLVLFRDHVAGHGPWARFLSANAFAVYVLHAVVLTALGIALSGLAAPAIVNRSSSARSGCRCAGPSPPPSGRCRSCGRCSERGSARPGGGPTRRCAGASATPAQRGHQLLCELGPGAAAGARPAIVSGSNVVGCHVRVAARAGLAMLRRHPRGALGSARTLPLLTVRAAHASLLEAGSSPIPVCRAATPKRLHSGADSPYRVMRISPAEPPSLPEPARRRHPGPEPEARLGVLLLFTLIGASPEQLPILNIAGVC
jgi:hypothetical protein